MRDKKKITCFMLILTIMFTMGLPLSTDTAAAASHKHSYKVVKTKASTCKKKGYKTYKCKKCSKTKKVYTKKKTHTYKCYKTKTATCKKAGKKYYKCKRCKAKKTTTIAKAHKYVYSSTRKATCEKDGYKLYKCKYCGKTKKNILKKTGHTYRLAEALSETDTKEGYEIYACRSCKSTYKKIIPMRNFPDIGEGGQIHLQKTWCFKYPEKEDFEEYYEEACLLYDHILKNDKSIIAFDFPSGTTYNKWLEKFNEKVLNCTIQDKCLTGSAIYITQSKYEIMPKRAVRASFTANRYNLIERFNYKEDLLYEACIKAGLKDGMSEKEAVIKINEWICSHLEYEFTADTIKALETGKGQCSDYANIFEGMCSIAGIDAEYVKGNVTGTNDMHAWNKVRIADTWYYVDSCWNDSNVVPNRYLLSEPLWADHSLK